MSAVILPCCDRLTKLRNNYTIYYSLFYTAHYYFTNFTLFSVYGLYTNNWIVKLNRKLILAVILIKEIGRYRLMSTMSTLLSYNNTFQSIVSRWTMPQNDRIHIEKKIQSLPTVNHRSSSCVLDDGYVNTVNRLRSNAARFNAQERFVSSPKTDYAGNSISGDDIFQFNRPNVLITRGTI